ATEEDAFANPNAAKDYLYSIYGYMPNKRSSGSLDLMTTDEIVTAFEHENFAQFPKGQYTPANPVIQYWSGLYKGIRQGYIFLNNIDSVPELSERKKTEYKAEAKFLIGYFHFLLTRMYGPIIIQEEVVDVDKPYEDYKARAPYDETINHIADIFDEAAKDLPAKRSGSEYGRATSVIAKSIKARMLLYAASPLYNGGGKSNSSYYEGFTNDDGTQLIPTEYDPEKWKRAANAAKDAIDAAESVGHTLFYGEDNVSADLPEDPVEKRLRFTFMYEDSPELIWTETREEGPYGLQNKSTPRVSEWSGTWNGVAPTITILEAFYTENGLPIDKDPNYNYEKRYDIGTNSNGTTLNLNRHRGPRFEAWISYHNSYYEILRPEGDQVLMKYRKYDNGGIQDRSENYSPTGYLNKKGVHPLLDQSSGLGINQQYPWPKIRLAELYLNYAEALIGYGQDLETAKKYIDKVRKRAG